MLNRVIRSVVIGVVVTLICILVGSLFLTLNVGLAVTVGGFLRTYAAALGVLAALYVFATGGGLNLKNS